MPEQKVIMALLLVLTQQNLSIAWYDLVSRH